VWTNCGAGGIPLSCDKNATVISHRYVCQ
jgi:hypothetical protein